MIMSGWILPDMYEVKCESCSRVNGHLAIVKQYLAHLKQIDYNTYAEILNQFYRLRTLKKVLDLEDFAVVKLGWIKVLDSPIKIVFYSVEKNVILTLINTLLHFITFNGDCL